MTPYPDFKVRPFFDVEYIQNGCRYGHQWRRHHGAQGARAPHYYEWLGTGGTVDKVYLLQCSDMPILLRTAGQKLNSIWRFGRLSKKKTIARYSEWNCDPFLTCVRRLTHVIAIGWTSVRPFVSHFVRPSHAGIGWAVLTQYIVSKRLNLSSNCLHCLVALWF